jgi:hypothetical protein
VSNVDDDMPASDRNLMKALAEAIGGPPPPVDLAGRCEGLLAWIDVDSDLAALLDQPLTEVAGTRGTSTAAADLVFMLEDGTYVIEIASLDDSALRGQVLGGAVQEVIVRTTDGGTRSLPVDELGAFSLGDPPSGTIRLEMEPIGASRRIHTDWFVI